MSILAINKKATYDYEILEKYTAGVVLLGHEVKAIKSKGASLKGAFVTIKSATQNPEVYLTNCQVPKYKYASVGDYDPVRPKKLLLTAKEISHLVGKQKEKGLTLVPFKLYTNRSLIKLEFGVGRGKKQYDKREDIKRRDVDRQIKTLMRNKK